MTDVQTARENPSPCANRGSAHIPKLGDALRRVFNALETLHLAAEQDGNTQALLSAQVCVDVLIPIRGSAH
ncbi:MAG TPA: hypothetical protein VK558_14605 [Patescibacteria group bacterium]|nr:hypothetical protein [Patescibacteria group bacterium]